MTAAAETRAYILPAQKDTWETPPALFAELDAEFGFTLDPCCQHETAKCAKHYTPEEDGLAQSWAGEVVYMNPPYGRQIVPWMAKAYRESLRGATVVCLVPVRSDTAWWHEYAMNGEIRFLRGRVKFVGGASSATFPSAVVIFRPEVASDGR
jgi:site-specific DNA-methyltransferase (adenine-specific)